MKFEIADCGLQIENPESESPSGATRYGVKSKIRHGGFTLIEMLIVVLVIAILMALLLVLSSGVDERVRVDKTLSLISRAKTGVMSYNTELGQGYPPSAGTYASSQNLHYYLGQRLTVPRSFGSDGSKEYRKIGPLVQFEASDLEGGVIVAPNPPVYLADAWGNRLVYDNPNTASYETKAGFTITSPGKDGDINTTDDNVTSSDRQ